MLKPFSMSRSLVASAAFGFLFFASQSVLASPPGYDTYSCTTYSNGQPFYGEDYDQNYAAELAVQSCQQNRSTNYDECSRNVTCGSAYDPYENTPTLELAYLLEGPWTTPNGPLTITRYGNQLYGSLYDRGASYQEPVIIISSREIQFRGDRFAVSSSPRNGLRLTNLSTYGRSGLSYADKFFGTARPHVPVRPRQPIAYPRRRAPLPIPRMPVPIPPRRDNRRDDRRDDRQPNVNCPPGTVYNPSIGRCESIVTAPSPRNGGGRVNPGAQPLPAPAPGGGRPRR